MQFSFSDAVCGGLQSHVTEAISIEFYVSCCSAFRTLATRDQLVSVSQDDVARGIQTHRYHANIVAIQQNFGHFGIGPAVITTNRSRSASTFNLDLSLSKPTYNSVTSSRTISE